MGKRELLIICAFLVVGAVAYSVTAPPPKPGERSFSISQIFSNVKREISAHSAKATVTKKDTIAIDSTVKELRVSTARSVPITIIGEDRQDIGYDMPIESDGPDEVTAREWANKADLRRDDLGTALALSTYFPDEGRQNASLTLRVPARLSVRVENSNRINVSNVASLELRNPAGDVTVSEIAGAVTGGHRSGELSLTGADSVNLTLTSSQAKIHKVARGVTVVVRNGNCTIAASSGPIVVTGTNAELAIEAASGSVKVGGDGGQIKIQDAQHLSIDVRRMVVQVDSVLKPGAEFSIITTDEPLRIGLSGAPSLVIDAIASSGGAIRAKDFNLEPTMEARESRLKATVGKGDAHVVLRNARGDIVIGQRK